MKDSFMKKETIQKLRVLFECSARNEDGIEFWYARDLQELLDYEQWRNFLGVIDKAKFACRNSNQPVTDHFAEVSNMVTIGSDTKREVSDLKLTRYACYLIAQNGDPRKDQIAFAQSYFAMQTRRQELIEERIAFIERVNARQKLIETETELSKLIFERGVDEYGFARIRSKGDEALFGGYKTAQMKEKLMIPQPRALADFLPTITISAKNLATEITNYNVRKDDLLGEPCVTDEHVKNNKDIRALLAKSGIKPENLPAEEDLRMAKKRIRTEEKRISGV